MRQTQYLALLFFAAIAAALLAVFPPNVTAEPRYLENIAVGGGSSDTVDGGTDLLEDGDIITTGDITLDGGSLISDTASLNLKASGACLEVLGTGLGKLRLHRTQTGNASLDFYHTNSASADHFFNGIYSIVSDSTADSEDGYLAFACIQNGTIQYTRFSIDGDGDASAAGDLTALGGSITGGTAGSAQGKLTLHRGGAAAPGFITLSSPNGTLWRLFVEDDGTLKLASADPTQNSDGGAVGDQTD